VDRLVCTFILPAFGGYRYLFIYRMLSILTKTYLMLAKIGIGVYKRNIQLSLESDSKKLRKQPFYSRNDRRGRGWPGRMGFVSGGIKSI
jgi:hypothetical protein